MTFKTTNEIIILVCMSVITAFVINYLSPNGISIIGQWDESKGVITAKAKNSIVFQKLEIDELKFAKQLFNKGDVVFVDARSKKSYEDGHVKNAISLPVGEYDLYIDSFLEKYPESTSFVTYCSGRACDDSHSLAQNLLDEGYKNVLVMIDGYPAWKEEGYPVE